MALDIGIENAQNGCVMPKKTKSKTKSSLKLSDLKPKKDAKGGVRRPGDGAVGGTTSLMRPGG